MSNLIRQQIGERIDKVMTDLDLSNVEVAKFVDVSKVAVGKWRKGETEPTASNVSRLAQILKTNTEWLVTGKGEAKSQSRELASKDIPASSSSLIVLMDNLKDMESKGELTPQVVSAINGVIEAVKSASQTAGSTATKPQPLDFHAIQAEAMANHGKD